MSDISCTHGRVSTVKPISTTPSAATVASDDPIRSRIRHAAETVRETTPLAQSFTNFVTINLVANAQLAAGGTAAMSFLPDDIIDMTRIAPASYINVGTLLPFYKDALGQITRFFHANRHRWVLDPVAAGIGSTRTAILQAFKATPPTVIRGNASEIIALSDMWELAEFAGTTTDTASARTDHTDLKVPNTTGGVAPSAPEEKYSPAQIFDMSADGTNPATTSTRPAGVESADAVDSASGPALRLARFLANHVPGGRAAVAVSGAADLVTDGERVYRLLGGSAMMTKITGAGCALGGVLATYLAVSDPLTASLAASALFDRAGELAQRQSQGPGSFQSAFLDALWHVTADQIADSPIQTV